MKYVPKPPGPETDNSSGGGLDEFLKEAAVMLAAHWVLGTILALLFLAVLLGILALTILLA